MIWELIHSCTLKFDVLSMSRKEGGSDDDEEDEDGEEEGEAEEKGEADGGEERRL